MGGEEEGEGVIIREKFINRKVSHSDSEGMRNSKRGEWVGGRLTSEIF